MAKITQLIVVFQREASPRARKNVVRKGQPGGAFQLREVMKRVSIRIGAGTDANKKTARKINQMLKGKRQGEIAYYVKARIKRDNATLFKTIVPRTQL
jgi:hypothetical protein